MDGNLKIILGMLWRLIQRFQLSKDNSRAWLLNWCKETLGKYDKVSIQNFQSRSNHFSIYFLQNSFFTLYSSKNIVSGMV